MKSKKIIRLTESDLERIIKRVIESKKNYDFDLDSSEDTPIEDLPIDDEEDYIEDYGFDIEDDMDSEYEDLQRNLNLRQSLKKSKPASSGIGDSKRWEKADENPKPWSPIKPSDMPLSKYLNSKKSKK